MTSFTTRPELRGTFGAAASTHWLASQTAMAVLERGGNAFDAAFAAGMVLQVAEPHLNGPGGDCPIIVHAAATRDTKVLCGQGPLPEAATVERFRALGLEMVPGTGLLAAVVPGAFAAWATMLRDYGTWSLADALSYAIGYARDGVPLVPLAIKTIAANATTFRTDWPSSAAVFLPNDRLPGGDDLFINPALAETWSRLVREAEAMSGDRTAGIDRALSLWYSGFVAEAIDRFARKPVMDSTGRANAGLLTGDDLARWVMPVEAPLGIELRGLRILKCGFWSQGPVLLQTLQILKSFDLSTLRPGSADFIHIVAEATKLAFADRETFYGDPDFVPVPADVLLSEAYGAQRAAQIDAQHASLAWRPGDIPGFGAPIDYEAACARQRAATGSKASGVGEPTVATFEGSTARRVQGDTCHLDVVDRHGNMVSATPSGGWLQSSPVIPELGFALGTRAQMVWLDPNSPAAPAPNKRPRTTLTPTMITDAGGRAVMACGTPGGDQQDQWQLSFLLRHLMHGQNLQEAIDAPSFHSEHWPGSFYPRGAVPGKLVLEGRIDAGVRQELERRGHVVTMGEDWSEGRLSAVSCFEGHPIKAAANPRGMQGYAVCR